MSAPSDTAPAVERLLIEGYRLMSPTEKLERVAALNRGLGQLATARLRAQYGQMTGAELRLRRAALRLDARTMRDVFGWAAGVHGL